MHNVAQLTQGTQEQTTGLITMHIVRDAYGAGAMLCHTVSGPKSIEIIVLPARGPSCQSKWA